MQVNTEFGILFTSGNGAASLLFFFLIHLISNKRKG